MAMMALACVEDIDEVHGKRNIDAQWVNLLAPLAVL